MSKEIKNKKKGNRIVEFLRHPYKPLIVLLLGVVLLYANTLTLQYALDDALVITENDFTTAGISGIPDILSSDSFTGFFGKQKQLVAGGRYRPLSQIMFATGYDIFGLNPVLGHLMNLLLYAFTCILIFILLRQMLDKKYKKTGGLIIAFAASLLYLAHPIHTEVVANIKGRDEILSLLFSLLTLMYSIRYIENNKKINLLISGLFFFLGMMSKENTITFLAIIPLSIYYFYKANLKHYMLMILPMLVSFIIYLVLRYNALGFLISGAEINELLNNPYVNAGPGEKLATNFYTWGKYILLLIFPHPLTHDYYPLQIPLMGFTDPRSLISILFYIGLIVVAIVGFMRKNLVSYAIIFFIASFSISSNLVFNVGTFMNERFMFAASLGFTLLLATGIYMLAGMISKKKEQIVLIIILPITLLYAGKVISRNTAWMDDYTLFTTDVAISSNSIKCNVSAGGKSLEKYEKSQSEVEKQKLLKQALVWLKKGTDLHPYYFAGWEQYGKAFFFLKDYPQAWQAYKNCYALRPNSASGGENMRLMARAAFNDEDFEVAGELYKRMTLEAIANTSDSIMFASCCLQTMKIDTAVHYLLILERDHPGNAEVLNKMGEVYGRYLNNVAMAESYLKRAVASNPEYVSALENLGIVYAMQSKFDDAIRMLLLAVEKEPENTRVITNLANVYQNMGNTKKAEEYFAMVNALSQGN